MLVIIFKQKTIKNHVKMKLVDINNVKMYE